MYILELLPLFLLLFLQIFFLLIPLCLFFVFSFLRNSKVSLVAFSSIFRSRHWEVFCKSAVRQDITKIVVVFFTKLELVFSAVYYIRRGINILKVKSCASILLELWSKSSSCNFTEQLLFLHSCEWLLLII